jgi:hypothetical protein
MGGGRAAAVAVAVVLAACEAGVGPGAGCGPPSVTLEPIDGVVTAPRVTLRGRVGPAARVEWRAGGAWEPAAVGPGGAFTLDVPTPEVDHEPFLIAVRATDARGREALATAQPLVDRLGPTLRRAAAGAVLTHAAREVTVVPVDASGQVARLELAGQRVTGVPSGAPVTLALELPDEVDLQPLEVPVVLEDGAGNVRREVLSVEVDTRAPAVAWLGPQRLPPTRPARLAVQVTDAAAVTSVRFALGSGALVDGSRDGVTWSAELTAPAREGPVTVTVSAVDTHGNERAERFGLVVDGRGPVVRLVSPAAGALLGGPAQADVEVLVEVDDDEPGTCEVEVTLEGGAPVRAELVPQGTQWSARVPLPDDDFVARVLEVVARDGAGNVSRLSRAVLVDRVAPVLTVAGPPPGARLNRASFAGTDDVVVTWSVVDGDVSASTRAFRGEPHASTSGVVTTRATDDGAAYGFDVVAADRAGNQAMVSRTFTVDRVTPTLRSVTPPASARNAEADVVEARFSEPVFGPTSASPAMELSPSTAWSGAWSPTHDTWRSGTLTPATAFEGAFAALTDSHGNPVSLPAPLRFHTAAAVPASGATLATGVQGFEVAADDDGVATLALRVGGRLQVRRLSPLNGALEAPWFDAPGQPAVVTVGRAVSAGTLASTRVEAVVTEASTGAWRVGEGVVTAASASALIAAPPMSSVDGAGPVGVIAQALYTRGPFRQAVGAGVGPRLAQSSSRWAALQVEPGLVGWTQLECHRSAAGAPPREYCYARDFTPSLGAAPSPEVSAAMTPSGRCLVVAYEAAGGRAVAVAPRLDLTEACAASGLACPLSGVVQATMSPWPTLQVAPFSAGGADAVLGAWRTAAGVQLGLFGAAAGCAGPGFSPLPGGTLSATVRSFRPIQLGNRAALLYIDAADSLKVFVP